ncbi:hypothetical protein BAUCODRAFT_64029, partial [Baudoinia panamericana UAMH 10762]
MAELSPRYSPVEDTLRCHESNLPAILGVTGAFAGAVFIAVTLRFYVRFRMLKFVGSDDFTMLAAMLMAIATFICFIGESNWGLGRHAECIAPSDLEMFFKWQFYHSLWVMFGVVLVKISVALFLMRLAPRDLWKRFLWAAIAFLTCFGVACAGTLIFSCVPPGASWNVALRLDPKTKCFSNTTFANIGLFNSIINIATDFLFALLPIPIVLGLQVNVRTKISLVFILCLGFVACAAGIVKAHLQTTFLANAD